LKSDKKLSAKSVFEAVSRHIVRAEGNKNNSHGGGQIKRGGEANWGETFI